MKNIPITTIPLLLALALVSMTGCATSGSTTRNPTQKDIDEITGSKLDNQDCAKAAAILVSRLIESGKLANLESPPNEPALLLVSRVVNSTGQQLDMDILLRQLKAVTYFKLRRRSERVRLGIRRRRVREFC